MEQLVVGSVQLRMHLPKHLGEIDQNFLRFVRMAQTKRVRLLVFPQLAGLTTAVPATGGTRAGLLKQADQARRASTSFWARTRARLAGGAAGMLRANFGKALEDALLQQPDALWDNYTQLFGQLARRHTMIVVAGTTYLVDPTDGAVRHMSLVFGPDGELLGQQAAVTLPTHEHALVEPGTRWQVIPTPAGRLGILIGNDMLYPEPARILAYAGAEILIGLGASTSTVQYQRQRHALLARVEENQLYGVMSFAVGYNPFTPADELPYVGRSLLAAPISMTPRLNGVLVEMGTDSAEGLITAEWDLPALRDLWLTDEMPLRATMPIDAVGPTLAAIYGRGLTIDQATRIGELEDMQPALPEPEETDGEPEEEIGLAEGEPTGDEEEEAQETETPMMEADEIPAPGLEEDDLDGEEGVWEDEGGADDEVTWEDLGESEPEPPPRRRWPWSRN